MALWGADVEQLRTLGTKLQHGANEIEQQKNNLNTLLNSTQWMGPDADAFKQQWSGEHMSQLTRVAESLKEASQKATRNAQRAVGRFTLATAALPTGPDTTQCPGPLACAAGSLQCQPHEAR